MGDPAAYPPGAAKKMHYLGVAEPRPRTRRSAIPGAAMCDEFLVVCHEVAAALDVLLAVQSSASLNWERVAYRAIHDSSNSRSSRFRSRIRLLSSPRMASARSRLVFCSSSTFSSTVSRAISR